MFMDWSDSALDFTIPIAFDSGLVSVYELTIDEEKVKIAKLTDLKKHENIVLKVLWSEKYDQTLYSIGFDNRIV